MKTLIAAIVMICCSAGVHAECVTKNNKTTCGTLEILLLTGAVTIARIDGLPGGEKDVRQYLEENETAEAGR